MNIIIKPYKTITKSDFSEEEARRLVAIIKGGSTQQGVAIMKSLRWSIFRALERRETAL